MLRKAGLLLPYFCMLNVFPGTSIYFLSRNINKTYYLLTWLTVIDLIMWMGSTCEQLTSQGKNAGACHWLHIFGYRFSKLTEVTLWLLHQ